MKARTRFIKDSFWGDKALRAVDIVSRFVYIGLWAVCDDAGWAEDDVEQIALTLMPWDSAPERERVVRDAIKDLVAAGRVVRHGCGKHLEVPNLHKYQRPGHPTYKERDDHRNRCNSTALPAIALDNSRPQGSGSGSGIGSGNKLDNEEKNGTPSSPRAGAHEGDVSFSDAMERHGWRRAT